MNQDTNAEKKLKELSFDETASTKKLLLEPFACKKAEIGGFEETSV